jgi:hypothetical protein
MLGPASSVSLVQHSLGVLHPRELHLEVFLVGPLASVLSIADPSLLTFRPTGTCYPVRPASFPTALTDLRRLLALVTGS